MNVPRKPPFALWVENVDPIRVDAKDLWEAFARYGDMCKPREHGARAVELLPESKAAIVNFASFEHACAALKGLQGALIGKITRPGLTVSWQKRQDEPQQQRAPISSTKEGTPTKDKDRPPFFGLWVGNVHASLVHEDEFRAAFEKYGELCHPQIHGVPSVNILPESSSAFVNFARYEDANAARKGLQGKLIGGAGPLRINASDLMQEYEQNTQQQQQQQQQPLTAPLSVSSFVQLPKPANVLAQGSQSKLQTGVILETDRLSSPEPGPLPSDPSSEQQPSEDGPVFELLGGEIYMFDSGAVVKVLWDRGTLA